LADATEGVTTRTAMAWVQVAIFMMEGFLLFNEVHALDEGALTDSVNLFAAFPDAIPELQKRLGWE
jgi:hypothetical protein